MVLEFEHIVISLAIIIFAATLAAEAFHRLNLPVVLGELIAGMVVGPYALGGVPLYFGQPLVALSPTVLNLGEIGAVVVLFVVGLEITPAEFLRGSVSSFAVGSVGVAVPFVAGFYTFTALGFNLTQSLIVATALTATSVAIGAQTLSHMGKLRTSEARLILGGAVVDDVLAIAVLSVTSSITEEGGAPATIGGLLASAGWTVLLFALLAGACALLVPRLLHLQSLWKSRGSIEAVTTALFFGAAGVAGLIGLSPIIGAFAVGMAVASSRVLENVSDFVAKLEMIFGPVFFGVIGAQVNLAGWTSGLAVFTLVLVSLALATKMAGCGIPALVLLRSPVGGLRVGVGMMARMEVALVIASIGLASGVLQSGLYSSIVFMAAITSVLTPVLLKVAYRGDGVERQAA